MRKNDLTIKMVAQYIAEYTKVEFTKELTERIYNMFWDEIDETGNDFVEFEFEGANIYMDSDDMFLVDDLSEATYNLVIS